MSDTTAATATAVDGNGEKGNGEDDERLAYRGVFQRILVRPEIGAAIGAIAIWIFFWAVSVPFGKVGGAASILDVASSPLGIMAVAVAMLMIGGEFDLSSGAATGALGILTILLVRDVAGDVAGAGFSLWVALPVSLAAALALGWFNGTLVNRTSLPSFIVTLASFFILKGAKLGFSKLIVEQIQVGKLNDLKIHAEETGGGDAGYEVLHRVFAAEWLRNDHVWDSRDWVYSIGVIGGLSLMTLAIYEMHFRRRDTLNPAGLPVFAGGVAASLVGIWRLHATDSTAGNWIGAIIIAAGAAASFAGWALWRYRSRLSGGAAANELSAAASSVTGSKLSRQVVPPIVGGLVASLVAVLLALWFDADNSQGLPDAFELGSTSRSLIAIIVGVLAVAFNLRTGALSDAAEAVTSSLGAALGGALKSIIEPGNRLSQATRIVTTFLVGFLATLAFFQLATEQGARAIFFVTIASIGVIALLIGVNRARRASQALGSLILLLTAAVVAGLAFFTRAQSATPKFRAQAFSVMLVIALIMAVWALISLRFDRRDTADPVADRFGRMLVLAGVAMVVVGMVARLMWVTQAELDAGMSLTKFSVRILWFLGFTAVATWVLGRTRFGSWTFAVGGNKQAARQIGVPASRTKTQLFMLVSSAAWLVGVLLAFRLNTIQASTGDGEEFEYIIAAVVGGTALTGGYGSTLGAAIGALIMAMSVQGIPSARWNSDWRFVFLGAILLLAVITNNFIRTKAEAAR